VGIICKFPGTRIACLVLREGLYVLSYPESPPRFDQDGYIVDFNTMSGHQAMAFLEHANGEYGHCVHMWVGTLTVQTQTADSGLFRGFGN